MHKQCELGWRMYHIIHNRMHRTQGVSDDMQMLNGQMSPSDSRPHLPWSLNQIWAVMPMGSLSTKTEICNIDWLMGNILPEGIPKLANILSCMTVWLCSCMLLPSVQFVEIMLEILVCHRILLHIVVPFLELSNTVVSQEPGAQSVKVYSNDWNILQQEPIWWTQTGFPLVLWLMPLVYEEIRKLTGPSNLAKLNINFANFKHTT
jgi:hypothetical protein